MRQELEVLLDDDEDMAGEAPCRTHLVPADRRHTWMPV